MKNKINIQITKDLKNNLDDLKVHSREPNGDVVRRIFHERNILWIHLKYGESKVDMRTFKQDCLKIFDDISFKTAPSFHDFDDEGNPVIKKWDSFESCLDWAIEMGVDEDLIGNGASVEAVPLSEAVTNVYCLMNDIPAPTWSAGGMVTPFRTPAF